ncbi:hypothetical protein GQ607_005702 [Colletotrichum asianum]|uniref:Uncharacterized protein n=1 Tax=Colletotrichum asianum TaxID=702518 RepID=A0A8H3WFA7_9PEZI|nr:hypothetical protein GQ607_005702 [Colletotrichum asianum]
MGPASHGLTYMARDQVLKVASSCDIHQSCVRMVVETMIDVLDYAPDQREACICGQIGSIIHNTSALALALMHCKFDPLKLRIPETSLTKGRSSHSKSWSNRLVPQQSNPGQTALFDGEIFDGLLEYLAEVFCTGYSSQWTRQASDLSLVRERLLGASGGAYTIHFSCIMENDCYDDCGRIIGIRTGRASVSGSLRNKIVEHITLDADGAMRGREETMAPSLLAGGSLLQPHYRPSKTRIFMGVALHETTIQLTLQAGSANSRTKCWEFTRCLAALLSGVVVPICKHEPNSVYVSKSDREIAVEGFDMARFTERSSDQVLVLALQGNKLEQLLACGMLIQEFEEKTPERGYGPTLEDTSSKRGVLQTSSCLECCIRLSQREDKCLSCVIIGG